MKLYGNDFFDSRDFIEQMQDLCREFETEVFERIQKEISEKIEELESIDEINNDEHHLLLELEELMERVPTFKYEDLENNNIEEVFDFCTDAKLFGFECMTQEFEDLKQALEELELISEVSDFWYGETFISDDYFVDYTKDLLVDCGYIPKDLPWWIEIDMEKTAENVKMDYSEYKVGGYTYFARS